MNFDMELWKTITTVAAVLAVGGCFMYLPFQAVRGVIVGLIGITVWLVTKDEQALEIFLLTAMVITFLPEVVVAAVLVGYFHWYLWISQLPPDSYNIVVMSIFVIVPIAILLIGCFFLYIMLEGGGGSVSYEDNTDAETTTQYGDRFIDNSERSRSRPNLNQHYSEYECLQEPKREYYEVERLPRNGYKWMKMSGKHNLPTALMRMKQQKEAYAHTDHCDGDRPAHWRIVNQDGNTVIIG